MCNSAPTELILHQYVTQKLHLIIRLPHSQKNNIMRMLLLLTNEYNGS